MKQSNKLFHPSYWQNSRGFPKSLRTEVGSWAHLLNTTGGAVGVGTKALHPVTQCGVHRQGRGSSTWGLSKCGFPGAALDLPVGNGGGAQRPVFSGGPQVMPEQPPASEALLWRTPRNSPFFFFTRYIFFVRYRMGSGKTTGSFMPRVRLVTLLNCPLVLIICRLVLLDILGGRVYCLRIMADLSCPF